ncbi:hypothetical protein BDW66DRAFT_168858 [Aspergillus desertorum]
MTAISTTPPLSRSLAGNTAIVTGAGCAGNGIGNGCAISILLKWTEKTVSMFQEQSQSSLHYSQAIAVQAAVIPETNCPSHSRPSAINASAAGTAVTVDMESWGKSLEVKCQSMVLMAKYTIPVMQKNSGVVNRSSEHRGAVLNMGFAMAANHAEVWIRWIRVNAREAHRGHCLLGTEGNEWDRTAAVVFLAGPHARWITGAFLPVSVETAAAVGIGMLQGASAHG